LFDDASSDEEEEDKQVYIPTNIDIDEIKINLYHAKNRYWPQLTSPSSLLLCLLDPRYKSLFFIIFDKWFTTE
ncbi:12656_t:CDS:1, partial [Racocetra fulgida]